MDYQEDSKKKGWFSKRYQTSAAYLLSKERRLQKEYDQFADAADRARERNLRTPEEQLAVLDKRLGKDVGAKRERKRLDKQIIQSAQKRKS